MTIYEESYEEFIQKLLRHKINCRINRSPRYDPGGWGQRNNLPEGSYDYIDVFFEDRELNGLMQISVNALYCSSIGSFNIVSGVELHLLSKSLDAYIFTKLEDKLEVLLYEKRKLSCFDSIKL